MIGLLYYLSFCFATHTQTVIQYRFDMIWIFSLIILWFDASGEKYPHKMDYYPFSELSLFGFFFAFCVAIIVAWCDEDDGWRGENCQIFKSDKIEFIIYLMGSFL